MRSSCVLKNPAGVYADVMMIVGRLRLCWTSPRWMWGTLFFWVLRARSFTSGAKQSLFEYECTELRRKAGYHRSWISSYVV